MRTENSPQIKSGVITVRGGLHSFLFEIGRVSKTAGPHFDVEDTYDGYLVRHHLGRWRAAADVTFSVITVESDDGQRLRIDGGVMMLGDVQVDQICAAGYRCFDAQEIRRRVAVSVLAWAALEDRGIETVAKAVSAVTGEPP
jgi:hypothetical protein